MEYAYWNIHIVKRAYILWKKPYIPKEPNDCERMPIYCEKSPTYCEKSPTYCERKEHVPLRCRANSK